MSPLPSETEREQHKHSHKNRTLTRMGKSGHFIGKRVAARRTREVGSSESRYNEKHYVFFLDATVSLDNEKLSVYFESRHFHIIIVTREMWVSRSSDCRVGWEAPSVDNSMQDPVWIQSLVPCSRVPQWCSEGVVAPPLTTRTSSLHLDPLCSYRALLWGGSSFRCVPSLRPCCWDRRHVLPMTPIWSFLQKKKKTINVKGQKQEAWDKNMARLHDSVKSYFRLGLRYGDTTVMDAIIGIQDSWKRSALDRRKNKFDPLEVATFRCSQTSRRSPFVLKSAALPFGTCE